MTDLRLVSNEPKFYEFIRFLRTTDENIKGFINQSPINTLQQKKYMEKHEKDYFICLSGETPVGFGGIVDNDIRFAVSPHYKNKGVGTYIIKELSKVNKNITAKVLLNNIVSQKVFEKNNFFLYHQDSEFKYYKL
jgi:GNAT superfamily N-acetyltransferase